MLKKSKRNILVLVMAFSLCLSLSTIVVHAASAFVYLSTSQTSNTSSAIGLSKVCNFMGGNSSASKTSVYMYGQGAKPGYGFITVSTREIYPGQQDVYGPTYNASDGQSRNFRVSLQTKGNITGCSASAKAYY